MSNHHKRSSDQRGPAPKRAKLGDGNIPPSKICAGIDHIVEQIAMATESRQDLASLRDVNDDFLRAVDRVLARHIVFGFGRGGGIGICYPNEALSMPIKKHPSPLTKLEDLRVSGEAVSTEELERERLHLASLARHIRTVDFEGSTRLASLPEWFRSGQGLSIKTVRYVQATTQWERVIRYPPIMDDSIRHPIDIGKLPFEVDLVVIKGHYWSFLWHTFRRPRFRFRNTDTAMIAVRIGPDAIYSPRNDPLQYFATRETNWHLHTALEARVVFLFAPDQRWLPETEDRTEENLTHPSLALLAFVFATTLHGQGASASESWGRYVVVNTRATVSPFATQETFRSLVARSLRAKVDRRSAETIDSLVQRINFMSSEELKLEVGAEQYHLMVD